jgi:hypothetical protein
MKTETNSQPESVVEGNRIIAEFMEVSKEPTLYGSTRVRLNVPSIGSWFEDRGLQYHTSWEWLMPVVEKVRDLGFKFIIGDSNRVTVYNKDYDWRNGSTTDSMIECVWHGCVQFIQFYNNQNRNNGR